MNRAKLYVGIGILTTIAILGSSLQVNADPSTSHADDYKINVTTGSGGKPFYNYLDAKDNEGGQFIQAARDLKNKKFLVTRSSPEGHPLEYSDPTKALADTSKITDGLSLTDFLAATGRRTDLEIEQCSGDSSGAGKDPSLEKVRELRELCFGGKDGLGPQLLADGTPQINPTFVGACVSLNLRVLNARAERIGTSETPSPYYESEKVGLLKLQSIFSGVAAPKYPDDFEKYNPGLKTDASGKPDPTGEALIDDKSATGDKHDEWEKTYKPIFAAAEEAIKAIKSADPKSLCRLTDTKAKEQLVAEKEKEKAKEEEKAKAKAKEEKLAASDKADKSDEKKADSETKTDDDPALQPARLSKRGKRGAPRRGAAARPGDEDVEPGVAQRQRQQKEDPMKAVSDAIENLSRSMLAQAQMRAQQDQQQQQQPSPYDYNNPFYNPYQDPYHQQMAYDPTKGEGKNEKTAASQPQPSPSSGGGGSPPSSSPSPASQQQPMPQQQQPMMGQNDPMGGMNPYGMGMPQNQQNQNSPLQDAMLASLYKNANQTGTAADAAAKLAATQAETANSTALARLNDKIEALADNNKTAASMGPGAYGPYQNGNMPTSAGATIAQVLGGGGAMGGMAGSRLMASRNSATRGVNLAARGGGAGKPFNGTGIVPMGPSNLPGGPANLRMMRQRHPQGPIS